MWLLDHLVRRDAPSPEPRSYDEIKAALELQDADPLKRLNRVEESLLSLTAEAGLEDLRRRLEAHRHG